MIRRYKKNKNYIIIGLVLILCLMAVGYSVFSSNLKISGISNISTAWNISITEITTSNKIGSATVNAAPSYDGLTASFSTNLVLPGDSITYSIKIENKGNLDAKLNKITIDKTNNPAIIFSLSGLQEGGILNKGESTTLNVMVTYSNAVTSQPNNLETSITVNLDFIQSDGTSNTPITTKGKSIEDLKALTTSMGDGLYMDSTENDRYIYKGAKPNNYIKLGNDMYRIVAIENDNTLKVMKNAPFDRQRFDYSYNSNESGDINQVRYSSDINDYCYSQNISEYYGCSVWGSKTTTLDFYENNITTMTDESANKEYRLPNKEAHINTYLNNIFYNALPDSVKEIIVSHIFNVGPTDYSKDMPLSATYNNETKYKWRGKIGLISISDYVKASSNTKLCNTVYSNSYLSNDLNTCNKTNYMFNTEGRYWSITSTLYTRLNTYVIKGYNNGINSEIGEDNALDVIPAFFISSNITLLGTGTNLDPYIPYQNQ